MVELYPDEQFTVFSLSGGTPKKKDKIKTISILMGPTFSTDSLVVETSDHARLELKLAYNWRFWVDRTNLEDSLKIFNIRDFIGDFWNLCASKIRGFTASINF